MEPAMSEMTRLDLPVKAIRDYCTSQQIMRLSALGADFDNWMRPDTEIGLLVEYLPATSITYIDMARQERQLGEIIGGEVDLRTPNELERHSRQQILEGATLVFAQDSRK